MTVHNIVDAVARLKSGKHDGHLGLSYDHVTSCMPRVLCSLMYVMLTSLIVHGSITDDLSSSTVVPIPKG